MHSTATPNHHNDKWAVEKNKLSLFYLIIDWFKLDSKLLIFFFHITYLIDF